MFQAILQLLRDSPEFAVFTTLALGNLVGRVRVGPVPLGSVTGCLLMGMLVGAAHVEIPTTARTMFFLLFLFSTGFSVGPQFFAGLRRDGLKLALFATVLCAVCVGVTLVTAMVMGWDAGTGAGLLAGANTSSIILGVASDTLAGTVEDPVRREALLRNIPMAYAVTYIFGTAGTSWFLVSIGARFLDKDVGARCRELEAQMGGAKQADVLSAHERVAYRAYRLSSSLLGRADIRVADLEQRLSSQAHPAFVVRVDQGGQHRKATPELILHPGDAVVVLARHELLPDMEALVGPEATDRALLSFPIDTERVIVTNPEVVGRTLETLRAAPQARAVGVRWLRRGGVDMPVVPDLTVQRGDQVELIGAKEQLQVAVHWVGHGEGAGIETSVAVVAAAIALGVAIGQLEVRLGNVPITLSLSGGVLLLGLLVGWLRERFPRMGGVPPAAQWVLEHMGLDLFIAMVGLSSSAGFLVGLKQMGLQLFLAGVVVSLVPVAIGLLLGRYVFRFHPVISLGATCGARTEPASLAVVQGAFHSAMPSLGFTVPYAVSNIALATLTVLMVTFLS